MNTRIVVALAAFALAAGMGPAAAAGQTTRPSTSSSPAGPDPRDLPPPIHREFRGLWIATYANIDWPSARDLSAAEQQAELLAILDLARAVGMNAVILQVRPAADALYSSSYEPWSEYLTGEMGRAPDPYWDPLAFAVEAAHRRGLQLHAWFNPFRARQPGARSPASIDHVTRARPDLVRRYGPQVWMDPGEPDVQEHAIRVILDVVRRYDIDGVHIDDYFYPYPELNTAGRLLAFPDDAGWRRYRAAGGHLSREDWRRDNVNRFVARLHREIRREKPWVAFGVSPFGIWRPGHPPGIRGLDAFGDLYADSRRWLANGWVDYLAPQLYWRIDQPAQSFPVLLDWWVAQNAHGRHLWPGLIPGRVEDGGGSRNRSAWPAGEILAQIDLVRARAGAEGHVLFSARSLVENRDGLTDALGGLHYASPAVPPAMPWLGEPAPGRPHVQARPTDGAIFLELLPGDGPEPHLWVVQYEDAGGWQKAVVPGARLGVTLPTGDAMPETVFVTAIGRTGMAGPAVHAALAGSTGAAR